MKAIVTTYKGPTHTRGSRIIASDYDGNRVIYDHSAANSHDQAHANAARALCRKMGWGGELLGPYSLPNNQFVFVFRHDVELGLNMWPVVVD